MIVYVPIYVSAPPTTGHWMSVFIGPSNYPKAIEYAYSDRETYERHVLERARTSVDDIRLWRLAL